MLRGSTWESLVMHLMRIQKYSRFFREAREMEHLLLTNGHPTKSCEERFIAIARYASHNSLRSSISRVRLSPRDENPDICTSSRVKSPISPNCRSPSDLMRYTMSYRIASKHVSWLYVRFFVTRVTLHASRDYTDRLWVIPRLTDLWISRWGSGNKRIAAVAQLAVEAAQSVPTLSV